MLIRNAEIAGTAPLDVRVRGGRIESIGSHLGREDEACIDADGGALLRGLHDHHIHLFALAAARQSARCGPPDVRRPAELAAALRTVAPHHGWVRGVGYHESVAGALDRWQLDEFVPTTPLRIQHRSGAMWLLNTAGLHAVGLRDDAQAPSGVERDERGRLTGRLFRLDGWLRERLPDALHPSLSAVGAELSRFGVTGVTDATPGNDATSLAALTTAVEEGLPQQLLVMGHEGLPLPAHDGIERGAVKILLDDDSLPGFDALVARITNAHANHRAVAIHCVTPAQLILSAAAFEGAGCSAADRIEHAAVAPPDAARLLAALGVTVVTQPNFIRERGDVYATDVPPAERPWLYRCQGLLEVGVPLGGGTDAPFGDPDPWLAMQAAVDRASESGRVLGREEALSPERALALFTSPADAPGAPPRPIEPGAPADLCLLDRPWSSARERLASKDVRATFRAGSPSFRATAR